MLLYKSGESPVTSKSRGTQFPASRRDPVSLHGRGMSSINRGYATVTSELGSGQAWEDAGPHQGRACCCGMWRRKKRQRSPAEMTLGRDPNELNSPDLSFEYSMTRPLSTPASVVFPSPSPTSCSVGEQGRRKGDARTPFSQRASQGPAPPSVSMGTFSM